MIRFLLRRLLLTIPVLLGVATLVFSLIHLVPGDPVQAMLGESASPQDIADLRARLGLDRPLYVQYAAFLKGALSGNLGTSLRTNQKVTTAIAERMPATFELAIAAMVAASVRCSGSQNTVRVRSRSARSSMRAQSLRRVWLSSSNG